MLANRTFRFKTADHSPVAFAAAALPLLAACFSLLFITSCGTVESGEPEDMLMPLNLGNRWSYLESEGGEVVRQIDHEVVGHQMTGPYHFAAIAVEVREPAGELIEQDTLYAYHAEGLFLFDSPDSDRKFIAYYRYPLEAGTRYQDPANRCILGARGSGIEVPAGTFDVVLYGPCTNFDSDRTMFAPGVGLVFAGNFAETARTLSTYHVAASQE